MRYFIAIFCFPLACLLATGTSHAAEPIGYACQAAGKRVLQVSTGPRCAPLYAADGFDRLVNSPAIIVAGHAGSIVRQGETVKLWEQIFLAQAAPDVAGKFRYDRLKASYEYNCTTRQQRLIQGTYSLGSARVYERSAQEAQTEEVEPGTVADILLRGLCGKQ